jgi:hypothetical protein
MFPEKAEEIFPKKGKPTRWGGPIGFEEERVYCHVTACERSNFDAMIDINCIYQLFPIVIK